MVPATAPSSGRTIRRRQIETRRNLSSMRPVVMVASRLPALMFPPHLSRRRTRTAFPFEVDYGMDISRRKDDYARRRHEMGEEMRAAIIGSGGIARVHALLI